MDMRLGFLFLLAFGFMGALRARQLPLNLQAFDYPKLANEVNLKDFRNEQLCVFCEEYAEMALDYLSDNKTQTEIIEALHVSCSQFGTLKKQCITLVDYYAPMFFLEISSIEPDAFCQKVGICKVSPTSLMMKENRCELCEDTVSDVLSKLRNPDTQMDVIHTLLKACDSMETFAAKVTLEIGDFLLLYELSSAVNRPVASADALRELLSSFTSMWFYACSVSRRYWRTPPCFLPTQPSIWKNTMFALLYMRAMHLSQRHYLAWKSQHSLTHETMKLSDALPNDAYCDNNGQPLFNVKM